MTKFLDINALEKVAMAATPGPWNCRTFFSAGVKRQVSGEDHTSVAWCGNSNGIVATANVTYISTFDPPTVMALIGRLRKAEGGSRT